MRGGRKQAILAPLRPPDEACPPDGVDRPVIQSFSFRRAAVAATAAFALTGSALTTAASAQAPNLFSRSSVAGNYLAARHAGIERDAGGRRLLLPRGAAGRSAQQ